MTEDKRQAFESWYIEHAREVAGLNITLEEMAEMRSGDNYGADRGYLNGCWQTWKETK
jgi:hypothetical protein